MKEFNPNVVGIPINDNRDLNNLNEFQIWSTEHEERDQKHVHIHHGCEVHVDRHLFLGAFLFLALVGLFYLCHNGIPINDNRDLNNLNEFQIWMDAMQRVAQNYRDNGRVKENGETAAPNDKFYAALKRTGEGIAVKADKDTPYSTIHDVLGRGYH